ncbi:MAG: 2-phosphosulfolactate phosphatase [Sulfolobales archaeon]
MRVDISWFVSGLRSVKADAYVVVDVLRFSTLVVTALSKGIEEIYVFADLKEAAEFSKYLKAPLAAEVDGIKPDLADLDNSPTGIADYVALQGLGSGKLVVRTTSGALLVSEAIKLGLKDVFIGSLVNAASIANILSSLKPSSVNIVCAGYRRRQFAIEDFLGAGAITYELSKLTDLSLGDEAIAATYAYESVASKGKLLDVIKSGRGGNFLWNTGRDRDVVFASKVNTVDVVPKLFGRVIRRYK